MKVLGIDFDANKAHFVLVSEENGSLSVCFKERITLTETRSAKEMTAFRDAFRKVLEQASPEAVSIRAKPENGQMRAGAAALKMEAVILAEATVPVEFVSSVKASKQEDRDGLFAYLQPAFKAAAAFILQKPAKKKG
jgi:Holliday junction resolvasome RuvABC endonuclease subunit